MTPRPDGRGVEASGGAQVAEQLRAFDWGPTPLGPRAGWSPALRVIYDTMMSAGFAMCATWGPERVLIYNADYIPFLADRHPDALGRPIHEVWAEVWPVIGPLIDQAEAGERVVMENLPLIMTRKGHDEDTCWTFSYSPLRDGETVMGILNVAFETTEVVGLARARDETEAELRRAVEQRTLLARELDHRVKNILAMVTAIAHQTFRPPATLQTAPQEFSSRIRALAKAQDLLTQSSWEAVDMETIARGSLLETTRARVTLSGPPVLLPAKSALALSLALHELVTNAVKYGALSADEGRVDISWTADGDEFDLRWIESGGPRVELPSRRGFGTRLVTSALSSEFRGAADIQYPPDGVHFTLKAPFPFSESAL